MAVYLRGDPGYPAGTTYDSRAPWNRDPDGPWRCEDCRETEDDVDRAKGTDYCQTCAKQRCMHECAHCGHWGHEEHVCQRKDKRDEWLCVVCAEAAELWYCNGCGLLCQCVYSQRDGERLCADCKAEADAAEQDIGEAMNPPAIHPVFAEIL